MNTNLEQRFLHNYSAANYQISGPPAEQERDGLSE